MRARDEIPDRSREEGIPELGFLQALVNILLTVAALAYALWFLGF